MYLGLIWCKIKINYTKLDRRLSKISIGALEVMFVKKSWSRGLKKKEQHSIIQQKSRHVRLPFCNQMYITISIIFKVFMCIYSANFYVYIFADRHISLTYFRHVMFNLQKQRTFFLKQLICVFNRLKRLQFGFV